MSSIQYINQNLRAMNFEILKHEKGLDLLSSNMHIKFSNFFLYAVNGLDTIIVYSLIYSYTFA